MRKLWAAMAALLTLSVSGCGYNTFKQSDYEGGVASGILAVTQHLVEHFPAVGDGRNELPDNPVVL